MSKVAIVYWSGTGNTEMMANLMLEGAKSAGAEVDMFTSAEFTADKLGDYAAVAFGCPSMGAEELEETEFGPMFSTIEGSLGGKKIALFGSYGWGDGEWMRTWQQQVQDGGAVLVGGEGLIVCGAPAGDDEDRCRDLGGALASA